MGLKTLNIIFLACLAITLTPANANAKGSDQPMPEPMPEATLRSLFEFADGATLKYSKCEVKSYPTCTYVWGTPDEKDAARIKYNLAPNGNKLMTIFAQASSPKDFERVLATYKDATPVGGLGEKAVWSQKRHQLSLITDSNMVIHVNVDIEGLQEPKQSAITVANLLLESN